MASTTVWCTERCSIQPAGAAALLLLKPGVGRGVKVFKQHLQVPFKTQNQDFQPLTHKKRQSHTSAGEVPSAAIDENTLGVMRPHPLRQRGREVAQISSPAAGIKAERDKEETRHPQSLPPREGQGARTEVSGVGGDPSRDRGPYFGFLVRGHAQEGEEHAAVQALLHVRHRGGRGLPLVELAGHVAQVGVQALLQGLIEDDLSQATEGSRGLRPHTPGGLGAGRAGARGRWPPLQPRGTQKG